MINELSDYKIFVDFGKGDIFYLKDFVIDEEQKEIILNGCQGQLTWVRIDEKYPLKIKRK